jgi:ADP-heptose:LPS heptosyltransferase
MTRELQSDLARGSVLAFLIGSLGDTIVALPSFHSLRNRFPEHRIVLLTNTPVDGGLKAASSVQILEGSGLVDDFIEYPHGRRAPGQLLRVIHRVRRTRPKVCVYMVQRRDPLQLLRDRLFFRACGIRNMIGFHWRRVEYRQPKANERLWESEASRLLRSVGIGSPRLSLADFSLHLSQAERHAATDVLARAGISDSFVAICAGTKVSLKDWGQDRWLDFMDAFAAASRGLPVVFIGSADEAERSSSLAQRWPWMTVNLCGKLTPRLSAAVLERAQLFVGHDSGPMHLAAAVGTPIIAVFAAREMPGIWFPFGQEEGVFYRNVPCRDCRLDECLVYGKRCIREIHPGDVAERAMQRLQETARAVGT